MTIEEALRFVDHMDAAYAAGEEPLEADADERELLRHGSSEERRRRIAERHFAWARWAEMDRRLT